MDLAAEEIVERICKLPAEFYAVRTKSIVQLVGESSLRDHLALLTVSTIERYLEAHPEDIQPWFLWSADKRVTSGWFFTRRADSFAVEFYPDGEGLSFSEPERACAEFVVREVTALLAIHPRAKN